jgi:hypothetical protein
MSAVAGYGRNGMAVGSKIERWSGYERLVSEPSCMCSVIRVSTDNVQGRAAHLLTNSATPGLSVSPRSLWV